MAWRAAAATLAGRAVLALVLIVRRSHRRGVAAGAAVVWSALFDLPKIFRRNHFLRLSLLKKLEICHMTQLPIANL